jgi:hypothetical protein
MSDIKFLIEKELKDFVDFLAEKKYILSTEMDYSKITPSILQELINEYLENF